MLFRGIFDWGPAGNFGGTWGTEESRISFTLRYFFPFVPRVPRGTGRKKYRRVKEIQDLFPPGKRSLRGPSTFDLKKNAIFFRCLLRFLRNRRRPDVSVDFKEIDGDPISPKFSDTFSPSSRGSPAGQEGKRSSCTCFSASHKWLGKNISESRDQKNLGGISFILLRRIKSNRDRKLKLSIPIGAYGKRQIQGASICN